jgi:DNA polymerase III subunit gamma/tau
MAYEVTANRRRPQAFEQLAGQEFVSSTLRRSITAGAIAHAYLFSGPRGCGKTSTARILAKALNCEKGPTDEPCGTCDSCVEIARGASLDVIEIDGASNTSVDNVRQIRDEVLFPPNGGRSKVYIIDEVHMLSNSAFNALLKTIEEPPPYIVFIFATTELHKVPATIRSRCQQFNFRLVPPEKIRGLLAEAVKETGARADDDALFWIAKESTGSIRDAYTLLDQALAFSANKITLAAIKEKLGVVGLDELNLLVEACAAGKTDEAFAVLDELLGRGISVDQLCHGLAEYLRGLLLLKAGVTRDGTLGYPRERFSAAALAALDREQAERGLSVCLELHRLLRYSVNPRFEVELAVSRLCGLSASISPARARAEIAALKAALQGGSPAGVQERAAEPGREDAAAGPAAAASGAEPGAPESFPKAPPPAVAADGTVDLAALRTAVIQAFRKIRVMLAVGMEKSAPWFIEGERLVLPFASRWEADIVGQDARAIAEKLQAVAGRSWDLEFRSSQAPRQTEAARKDEAAAGRDGTEPPAGEGEGDPVKNLERMFKGKVVGERDKGGQG